MANWSELPEDIIDVFINRLPPSVEDFVTFGAVCKSWRSVAIAKKQQLGNESLSRFAPWLMLAKRENDTDESIRSFYSLSSKKTFNIQLPQIKGRRCWGSPYGWLLTIGLDLNIHLFHPLTGIQISLPAQPTFQNQPMCYVKPERLRRKWVDKFVLGSNPSFWGTTQSNQYCGVMAIYGDCCRLAYATPGDKAWTSLEGHTGAYEDIIFFNDHFYAINTSGQLKLCEINATPPKATYIASPPNDVSPVDKFYLIEMFGDLHLVVRQCEGDDNVPGRDFHYDTRRFDVYKFDFGTTSWIELCRLDDQALFVGTNTSFAISASDYLEFNDDTFIYFTDDNSIFYKKHFCDMGVFNFWEETVEPFYVSNEVLSKFSRPVFFMPTLS